MKMLSEESLVEAAVLMSVSAIIHYCCGIYGLLGAVMVYCGVDRSEDAIKWLIQSILHTFHAPKPLQPDAFMSEEHKEEEQEEEENVNATDDELRLRQETEAKWNVCVRDLHDAASGLRINARSPIAFETDVFVGRVLILVRTEPEDSFWSHLFRGKRRRFWIQVQGQFKKPPQGIVYLGGELPSRVTPGFFTRSIALMIMGIIKKLVGKVHFSFGDAQNHEVPHVSFPLFQSVDQFMKTPPEETPPPLGVEDFGETEHARRVRRSTPVGHERFEVGPTYSFHFHTMYVDLTTWKTKNLPGMSDMELTTFFDSLPLRLAAYDVCEEQDKHAQQAKRYLFCFQVHPRDRSRDQEPQSPVLRRTESEQSAESVTSSTAGSSVSADALANMDNEAPSVANALDKVTALHAENAQKLAQIHFVFQCWMEEVDVATAVRRVHYVLAISRRHSSDQEQQEPDEASDHCVVVSSLALRQLLNGKNGRSPAPELKTMRFHSRSRIGSYSTITDEAQQIMAIVRRRVTTEIAEAKWDTAFLSSLYRCLFNGRETLDCAGNASCTPSKLGVNLTKRDRIDMQVAFEGILYRFATDSFLRQEVLVVTANELLFYRTYSTSPEKIVQCDRIIGVQATSLAHSIGESFAFAFQINTFAEEIVVCVHSDQARSAWIRVILQHCSPQANFDRALAAEDMVYICYTPNKSLQPANRMVLNARRLFPPPVAMDPMAQVDQCLRSALRIHAAMTNEAARINVMDILEFLNHVSALRTLDLDCFHHERSHEDKLCFYLNLYHVVLAHAMMAHGFPRSKSQWDHFVTRMCYVIGRRRLCLSLAELEHVVLRARMPLAELPYLSSSSSAQLVALRQSNAVDGLAHPDFRLTFALALNAASTKQSHGVLSVVIFTPLQVHNQLNRLAQQYLRHGVQVESDRALIWLPRICEWYRFDFDATEGSAVHCVRKLVGFFPPETQADAMRILDPSPTVKFHPFRYAVHVALRQETTDPEHHQ